MKSLGLGLLTVSLLLAFTPATSAQGETAFTLVGHDDNGFYWTLEGQTAHNPDLVVPANTAITLTIKSAAGTHNICNSYDNKCSADYVTEPTDTQTLTFTSGSAGGSYWCAPHKSSGMQGKIVIAGSQSSTSTTSSTPATENKSPGFALVGLTIAVVGAALVLRRKA